MDNHPEVISRLKFIGKIQKGDKLNTRRMFVQPTGWITSLNRTVWNQDNRLNTLSFVQETVRRAFDLLDIYDKKKEGKEENNIITENIVKDLHYSTNGLINLKSTYCHDIKFCCDMDTLLELIKAKLPIIEENESEAEEKQSKVKQN